MMLRSGYGQRSTPAEAVAIAAVILFHAGGLAPGGYVGLKRSRRWLAHHDAVKT